MQDLFIKMKRKDKDGNVSYLNVNLIARPIQLWEFTYPREGDAMVSKLIGEEGYQKDKVCHKIKNFIAKIAGLKKPKKHDIDLTEPTQQLPRRFVGVHILGDKKDAEDIHGNETI